VFSAAEDSEFSWAKVPMTKEKKQNYRAKEYKSPREVEPETPLRPKREGRRSKSIYVNVHPLGKVPR
jgi:hypothetical protein